MSCTYLTCSWLTDQFGIAFNQSNSLPYYVFIKSTLKDIQKGQYVLLHHPKSDVKIAKEIVGLPGDLIQFQGGHILVNSRDIGPVIEKSKSGKQYMPIQAGVIPEGFYFVHATHPESFDSRYAEFGLVQLEQLEALLWPLF
jgi:conjugal transfer pilin signal peptidase TrbI